jgi:molecular chaperone HscB
MDPFAALGIPRSYDVDLTSVEKVHRELSRALHPDRFAAGAPSERRAALAKAVEVNEAWQVVRDPIRRAEALLRLGGAPSGEASDSGPAADPAFLMDMLEQREALADARRAEDASAVRAMAANIENQARDAERALSRGFARGEEVGKLARMLGELKFYRRFLEEASAIEEEIGSTGIGHGTP